MSDKDEKDLDVEFAEMANNREGTGNDVIESDEPAADDGGASDEDQFAGWPEEAKEKYNEQVAENEKLNHRISSDDGRVRAFQLQAEAAKDELAKVGNGDDKPSIELITAALESDEGWEEIVEDHPKFAAAIDKRINGALDVHGEKVVSKINETIAPVVDKQNETAASEAEQAVDESYPTWKEEVKTKDFVDWFSAQPAVVRGLDGDNSEDVNYLFGLYDNHRMASGKQSFKADLGSDVDNVTDVNKRRQQQINDGAGLESKPSGANDDGSEGQNSLDREWNVQAEKRERKQRA